MVHPNKFFREPLGLAPIEAMACGCPVIAWRNGAMRETVKEGRSGYLVDSMNSLIWVIKAVAMDPFYMGGDRKTCMDWAKQFSVEKMVSRYEELAIEALDGGGW